MSLMNRLSGAASGAATGSAFGPWGAVAGGVLGALTGGGGSSNDAAAIQEAKANDAAALQGPYAQAGLNGLTDYQQLLGLNGQAPDFSVLTSSPDYQFRLSEGLKALDNSGAARGMSLSGAQLKGAERFGQGLAASAYDSLAGRLERLVGVGQTAASNQGNLMLGAGEAAASGLIANQNANAQSQQDTMLSLLLAGQRYGNQTPPAAPTYPNSTGGGGLARNYGYSIGPTQSGQPLQPSLFQRISSIF